MFHDHPSQSRNLHLDCQILEQQSPTQHSVNSFYILMDQENEPTAEDSLSAGADATPSALSLADRMKTYEAAYESSLPKDTPIILRLDGHGFSRFTSYFNRPFDQRIHDAMISTSTDLLNFFPQATVAYTQSDEITLVFPAGVQVFSDRLQKLSSLAASFCSVHFNKHLATALAAQAEPAIKESAERVLGTAHFDARFFAVPSTKEALNCLLWRCRNDAVRNAVSGFARTMFTAKQLHGKRTNEVLQMMKDEKGVTFEEAVPKWAIAGSLMKREQFEHEGLNVKTGQVEKTTRTKVRVEDRGIREFSEENLKIVEEKYW